ncbi:MAG TPA: MarR family transcriptional regulator [Rhodobacteraceae bacterium]|jgi:DNA-binding MarR family transcriptional regulator|nr:MarR family transcriptional regulator [Paracoccaceae bacterium]
MSIENDPLAVALFGEIFMADQLARIKLTKALPKGMQISHFSVLNHLAHGNTERSPAQLAKAFHVTRGAMTNTLNKLEWAGHIHIRPDWDDARRKHVTISPSGRVARDVALNAITPIIAKVVEKIGPDKVRSVLPVLREFRDQMDEID